MTHCWIPVLAEIASAPPPVHNAQYWIEKTAQRSDDALDIILDRLVEKDILDHDSGGFLVAEPSGIAHRNLLRGRRIDETGGQDARPAHHPG